MAISGHKFYAPFGAGAFVGPGDWLDAAPPYLAGGGAVRLVTLDEVEWTTGEARHEALQRKRVVRLKVPLFLVRPAAYLSEKISLLLGKATAFNSDKYHIMKQRNWACDISPLQEAVGFQPKYRLKEGVAKTVAWYKERGWL